MEKKRSLIPYIISAILFVISLILGIWLYFETQKVSMGERALETTYMRSLSELSEYVTNISETLEKIQYVGTSGQMQILSARLQKDSSAAKNALSAIPTGELDLGQINKLLSQAGNYTSSLANKLEYGEEITEEEYKNLEQLKKYSQNLQSGIYKLGEDILNGNISSSDFYSLGKEVEIENKARSAQENIMENQIKEMENSFVSYPSLIYDGPFSDHIMKKTPSLTVGKPAVSREHAQVIAASAAELSPDEIEFTQMENSKLPSYCFVGENVSVSVSKNGGYIIYMMKEAFPSKKEITVDKAIANAQAYLKNLGITSMKNSYYEIKNNVCTINFAFNSNGVTCYTDLIKVSVNMENGEITGFDARGYIMNHHNRNIPSPFISKEQAEKSVSPRLKIFSVSRALIPTSGKKEIPVYEFKTKAQNGDTILVYVNQNNGAEEQILILIENEDGILTV